jgi:hypothetical protein
MDHKKETVIKNIFVLDIIEDPDQIQKIKSLANESHPIYHVKKAEFLNSGKGEKVYISGPITGMPNGNREAFIEAERQLRLLGFTPMNPFNINTEEDRQDRDQCLKNDIKVLMDCQYIFMLPGWDKSKGACLEKGLCDILHIKELQLV